MLIETPLTIKTYLYKYLGYYVKVEPNFVVSDKNRFGIYIRTQLKSKKEAVFLSAPRQDDSFCTPLKIAIPEDDQAHYGYILGHKQQIAIEKIIKDEFQERFVEYVLENQTDKKGSIHPSILRFRDRYQISEDELNFKTMLKWWERKRNRIYAKASWKSFAFTQVLSGVF